MKNAPKIDRQPVDTTLAGTAVTAGALAQRQRARVADMAPGNTIELTLPGGARKKFTLVVTPAAQVAQATMVSPLNQRHQGLLNEQSLADLLPSVLLHGILEPGMGRKVNGIIELGKGSRRRAAAILAGADYPALVGDLTDQEMADLDRISNYYLEPSAYERGHWYRRLQQQGMSLREIEAHLDEIGEPASRRDITRCIKTSVLPTTIMEAFAVPNDVNPRMGEQLHDAWQLALKNGGSKGMAIEAGLIQAERLAGQQFTADQVRDALLASVAPKSKAPEQPQPTPEKRSWGGGKVKMIRTGNRTRFDFAELTPAQVEALERTITLHLHYEKDITKEMIAASSLPEAWLRADLSEGQASAARTRMEDAMDEELSEDYQEVRHTLRQRWSELGDGNILTNARLTKRWLKEQLTELSKVPEVWLRDWGFTTAQASESWAKLEAAMSELVTGNNQEEVKAALRERWGQYSEPRTLLNIRLVRSWVANQLKELNA
jgi:ParB/RepB/Spo0J family partition protein